MTIDTTFAEEWRDIKGYYGYQVSNLGRIKSLGNKSNHLSEILMRQSTVLKRALDKEGRFSYG